MSEMRINTHRVEVRSEGEKKRVKGYASVYYRAGDPSTEYRLWENAYERIMPGAFDRAIREDDVRALFNHDPNFVLGRTKAGTLALSVDSVGLAYDISPGDTQAGRDVVEHVSRGDVTGSSFSFIPTKTTWIEEERDLGQGVKQMISIRQIDEVRLYDVGPVTFPAYEGTSALVRSEDTVDRAALEEERSKSTQTLDKDPLSSQRNALNRLAIESA